MKKYISASGKPSGVTGYEIADDRITVRFTNGSIYIYSYASAGSRVVGHMKKLAAQQRGLSTYISRKKPLQE